ncbi:MAG: SRPBCC family protein [Dermatophilaceae bacterium]
MSPSSDIVSVTRLIPAPPELIFDLLADPGRHVDIDGGGTVQGARSGGRRLGLGDRFGVDMKIGLSYATLNEVVEYDENQRIAWQTRARGAMSRVVGGRIWRYVLEPVEGGTMVTESWDLSREGVLSKPAVRLLAGTTRRNMAATLERIEELVTDAGQAPSATG